MLRCVVATTLLLLMVCGPSLASQKEKRQVTYQADDSKGSEQEPDVLVVRPVTMKPLPAQVMYPGDLTSFFTTDSLKEKSDTKSNTTKGKSNSEPSHSDDSAKVKRSLYLRDIKGNNGPEMKFGRRLKSSQTKQGHLEMSESRLHSSYHKPSVSVMNDIPAEMYFDGAGFLRYEDDSEEVKTSQSKARNNDASRLKSFQDNNKALKEFRQAFNMSDDRGPTEIKYDDDVRYPSGPIYSAGEGVVDHGAQGSENGTPLSLDFMNAYQKQILENMQNMQSNFAQPTQNSASYQQDPFSFTYPNFYNSQTNYNQMSSPVVQQEPSLLNHRIESSSNIMGMNSPGVYASSQSQPLDVNPGYATNINYAPFPNKVQRKKRSVILGDSIEEKVALASESNEDRYRYPRAQDQQDSSSGFIPVTGSFNGGTIQLNFPIFGSTPISSGGYGPRPPVQTFHTYSVPLQPDSRHYRNSMERFYHPSEARRYSYGILGSGNFEVIRGGVFPGERQQGFSGGYQDGGRIPYGNPEFGNYGTTEIIIDGPIQGFQGFDNFPAHLINALSKHSELSVRPDRRELKDLAL